MPEIKIKIKNKIAESPVDAIVCGNSDYKIKFIFDDEWSAYDLKTARFVLGGKNQDIIFNGNTCDVPIISDTNYCAVGVFAGELHTTTPALITCTKSILCYGGVPADPTPEKYEQILKLMAGKQDKLTAGNGISISDDSLISIIGGGSGTDISLGLTSASVGQIIKVKAVDENGKPTLWEAAEMDEDFELINEITVAEDVGSLTISVDKDGNPFELKEAVVLSWTVPFAESTNDIGRAQGFSSDSRWGYHVFPIASTLPAGKSYIGRYDLIHVKVINGYIMQMGRWLSQNSGNVRGALMMSTAGGDAPFNFEIKDDEGTPTLKNYQGNITCYKIVSYGNPAIAAGSIIRLYGKRA